MNFELLPDEVKLFEGTATSKNYKGQLQLTLTSKKLIIEQEKGFIKKQKELIGVIELNSVKTYNSTAQIKQKNDSVEIQTIAENLEFTFSGIIEAKKFAGKIIDAATGKTFAQRGSEKIKSAFSLVDETLGIDSRGAIKGIIENGVKGTILNGLSKKK